MASIHSPKNPYTISINFAQAVEGIGSVCSYTSESVDWLIQQAVFHAKQSGVQVTAYIRHNKLTYPSFDWEIINVLEIDIEGNIKERQL